MKRVKSIFALILVIAFALGMPASAAAETAFTDVSSGAWYAEAVAYCYDNGLMVGTSEAEFSPNARLSRAMVVTMLHRATGEPAITGDSSFTDVESGAWYTDAVVWSEQNDIIAGYGNGLFGTNDPVTREELITILWRYNGSQNATATADFSDAASASTWAEEAIAWAGENGIANIGSANSVSPMNHASRAETAYMFKQLLSPSENTTGTPEFDFESRTVTLNNGIEMPLVGIGTFTLTDEQAADSVYHALTSGYTLIDTANAYGNEVGVGEGIARAGVPREEIFVTTKLWPADYDDVARAIDDTLERLGLDYIDLLLLHQPYGNYTGAYLAMEAAVSEGKVRSIGLSNFSQTRFEEIMEVATITPAVLQSESNPWFHQTEMREYIAGYGTVFNAWFPLGGRGQTTVLLSESTIVEIAEAHGVNPAQVVLRWHLQVGNIAIPGSTNPDHIRENISNFDFELTDEEMERIRAMDRGYGAFDFSDVDEQPDFDSWDGP